MRIVGICPCRNEDWIAGFTFRAHLMWLDHLVVLDHASTIPVETAGFWDAPDEDRVTVLHEPSLVWDEMRDRQRLLDEARRLGATHIVYIDADEAVTANIIRCMRDYLRRMPSHCQLYLPWIQIRDSIDRMHVSGLWARSNMMVAFQDTDVQHWHPDAVGYQHHHREPYGVTPNMYRPVEWGQGGLLHFQMADEYRLRVKQFWYCLVERLRWPARKTAEQIRLQYSPTVYGSAPARTPMEPWYPEHNLAQVPEEWIGVYRSLMDEYLHLDTGPWQLEACQEMLRVQPSLRDGLDAFGTGL